MPLRRRRSGCRLKPGGSTCPPTVRSPPWRRRFIIAFAPVRSASSCRPGMANGRGNREVAVMARWLWISWAVALCMMSARVACAAETPPVAGHLASAGMVAQLALDGPIGPAAAEYFDDASKHAVADGAVAIVLRLDTPGGLSDSMRQIIAGMLACKVPVLVFVAPAVRARLPPASTFCPQG